MIIIIVTRPPLESYLNWIADPTPIPPRKDTQENLPPSAEPRKLPRKIRPRRQKKHHHHHLAATGSAPGTSQPPRCVRSTPVKHPSISRTCSIHSLTAQQPITIQNGLISWIRLNSAGYINRPGPASARIPQPDLVETTSPGLTSPSLPHSDLIETTSLGRPVGL